MLQLHLEHSQQLLYMIKVKTIKIGDAITITAAGGGTGLTVTVSDIDGQGVVLKPSAGSSVL